MRALSVNVQRRWVYICLLVTSVLLFLAFLPLTLIPFGYSFGGGPEAAGMLFFYLLYIFSPFLLAGASVSVYGLLAGPAVLRLRTAVWYLCLALPYVLFHLTDIGENDTAAALIVLCSLSFACTLAFCWSAGVTLGSLTSTRSRGGP